MLERIHSGVRYLERKKEFGKRKKSDQRIQEEILARYGKHSKTRV